MKHLSRGFLDDCENEKLQFSGAIQTGGALVIANQGFELTHWSANFYALTGLDPTHFLEAIADQTLLPAIHAFPVQTGYREEFFSALETPQGVFDLVITRGAHEALIIEFFEQVSSSVDWIDPPDLSVVKDLPSLMQTRQQLVEWLAAVTGFDRVMYYQFLAEGDGHVVAEVSRNDQGCYLGLRFPASDIPLIARQLYLKNPWRVIHDAQAASVALLGE